MFESSQERDKGKDEQRSRFHSSYTTQSHLVEGTHYSSFSPTPIASPDFQRSVPLSHLLPNLPIHSHQTVVNVVVHLRMKQRKKVCTSWSS